MSQGFRAGRCRKCPGGLFIRAVEGGLKSVGGLKEKSTVKKRERGVMNE